MKLRKASLAKARGAFLKRENEIANSFPPMTQSPASSVPEALHHRQPKTKFSLALYRDKVKRKFLGLYPMVECGRVKQKE